MSIYTICPGKKVLTDGPENPKANIMTFVSGTRIYFQNRPFRPEKKADADTGFIHYWLLNLF
jgi:hypothetical protein